MKEKVTIKGASKWDLFVSIWVYEVVNGENLFRFSTNDKKLVESLKPNYKFAWEHERINKVIK